MKEGRPLVVFLIVPLMLATVACSQSSNTDLPAASPPAAQTAAAVSGSEKLLLRYLINQQTGEFGVFTNRLDSSQEEQAASGHEVLSESAGLLMRYYVNVRDEEGFKKAWAAARQTFDSERLFSYRFSPKGNKKYPVNAAVDDLRIIRALYEASDAFGGKAYREEANRYAKRFYSTNVRDRKLFDLYDEDYDARNRSITLCYIDLFTLRKLPVDKDESERLQSAMLNVIQKGYLSDTFPFYETRYDYETSQYSSEHIHAIESLLTILHLAEIGQSQASSIAYIKKQVTENHLFGEYTKAGEPANDIRSTAIYAIAALIGHETSDDELYYGSLEKMKAFQVMDPSSPLYGGFGDPASGQAYSFDNLMALLAFSVKR
ncbi:hypothetical protein D3P08_25425 [Paenibacillus nanensis]|uniref:Glycosyl hydrolase n=1 Tax=Paenibacillus nanensis TaxID=393251 RepID=A0A3A1URJ9_9BACL|nr:glycosyl hydrolase family 8 [Paenibacillus nanensis]RIX47257.1 hypothetical protein D3P08_25425 [Paenibacillus nanensis]